MLRLLLQRNFGLLWFGGMISLTGDRVLSTALPFYIYQQTGSTLATGGMILAAIVPRLLFSSVIGVYVDRWNRKRIMVVANGARAGILCLLLVMPPETISWFVYAVVFFETVLSAFFRPAENALLPNLVPEDDLLQANSLNALNNTLARLVGPPLGGMLFGVFGLQSVLVFDIVSYLIAALFVAGIALPNDTQHLMDTAETQSVWVSWRSGLHYIQSHHIVAVLFIIIGLTTFAGTMQDPLVTPFVNDVLQGNALVLGWMLTAQGLGGVFASLTIGQWGRRLKPGSLLGLSLLVAGVLLLVVYNLPSIPIAIGSTFLLGFPLVATSTAMQTLLQTTIPDVYRGRVYGTLDTIGAALEFIGVSLTSVLGDLVGIVPLLNTAAFLNLVVGTLALILLPRRWYIRGQ